MLEIPGKQAFWKSTKTYVAKKDTMRMAKAKWLISKRNETSSYLPTVSLGLWCGKQRIKNNNNTIRRYLPVWQIVVFPAGYEIYFEWGGLLIFCVPGREGDPWERVRPLVSPVPGQLWGRRPIHRSTGQADRLALPQSVAGAVETSNHRGTGRFCNTKNAMELVTVKLVWVNVGKSILHIRQ